MRAFPNVTYSAKLGNRPTEDACTIGRSLPVFNRCKEKICDDVERSGPTSWKSLKQAARRAYGVLQAHRPRPRELSWLALPLAARKRAGVRAGHRRGRSDDDGGDASEMGAASSSVWTRTRSTSVRYWAHADASAKRPHLHGAQAGRHAQGLRRIGRDRDRRLQTRPARGRPFRVCRTTPT